MPDTPLLQPGRARHEQLADWLRVQIASGRYLAHDQLPSEHELGDRFGVSRITVRRSLATLEHEGLIYRRQGLGSFVAQPRLPQGLVRLTDFAQDMARAGLVASSRVLFHAPVAAPAGIAAALGLEAGTTVIRLDRLRLGNDTPIALDRTWLPPFYAQLLEGHDLARETIYQVLEQHYQIPVVRGRYRMEALPAGGEDAALLQVAAGAPLLHIERTSYTTGDRVLYYQRRYYRADRVAFDLELARGQEDLPAAGASGMPLREFEPVFKS